MIYTVYLFIFIMIGEAMIPNLSSVGASATLRTVTTNRFKSGLLSVSSALPITPKTACIAPLLLSVLRRGTEKYPTLAHINRRLEYLWGTGFSVRCFYRGNYQILGFSAELLDSAYLPADTEDLTDAALELLGEILFHPVLDADGLLSEKYVESEKALQCDAIRAAKNNPRGYAMEQCRAILYDGEPCGALQYGTEAETEAITREELTDFWRTWIKGWSPDCFYVGPADPALLKEKLERAFGARIALEKAPLPRGLGEAREGRGLLAREELPVSQSQLVIGLRCNTTLNDADYFATAVMNEMLGVSPISKLFMNVREKLSLCYSCSSLYNAFMGTLLISCGIRRENREQAEQAILREIRAIAEGDFREQELEAAKKSLDNAYDQLKDSPGGLENFFYGRALVGNCLSPEDCRAGFCTVQAEDVSRVARAMTVDVTYFLEGTQAGEGELDEDDGEEI